MRTTKRNKREARRLYRLCLVDGLLDESLARFVVQRTLEAGRHDGVGILGHFQRLVRLDRDRHTAHGQNLHLRVMRSLRIAFARSGRPN